MIKRALISVYDKNGIVEFVRTLTQHGYEIVSTSGTAKLLKDNGIKLATIEELVKFPEILGGRVKTLHPVILGGILADRTNPEHINQLERNHIKPFDLVVVNLYPFQETINKASCTLEEAIEQIDIGGVALIRAAAKNFINVRVIVSPVQYNSFTDTLVKDEFSSDFNMKLASEAFDYISSYDKSISDYFLNLEGKSLQKLEANISDTRKLRYGENPHQNAELLIYQDNGFDDIFKVLHGKELSYNNILDIDSAYNLINEFDKPVCAIIKHTNPCGVCSHTDIKQAYLEALSTDPVSAFGGIIITNERLEADAASEMDKIFSEIILAPEFSSDALVILTKKKNRRLVSFRKNSLNKAKRFRSIVGGILMQNEDEIILDRNKIECVTKRKPTEAELNDLEFAMKVAKHVKSNSVVYAKELKTLGIGGGQPSRVDSSHIAVERARKFGLDLKNSAVASDAFFPFPDGVIEAAKAGASSVIQPGGSVRDDEVIKAANEYGLAMVFTGIRHFRH